VKRGVATTARAIFLVRGHTKNDCDRLFNTMKKEYRKTNCFTPPQDLTDSMHHDKVKPIAVDPDNTFHDWDKLENAYLKVPTMINTKHIFTVDINRNNGNSMWLQESRDAIETEQVLVLPLYHNKDSTFWKELQPQVIPPIGIQDIKWQELFKKWGAFIPTEKKQQWRYYNEAPPKAKLKEVAKQTKEARSQRTKQSHTVHTNNKMPAKKAKQDDKTEEQQQQTGTL
jgi:hypothetical protein